ncbi:MAG: glycosyltransferase family 2 protein [Acidobacteriota bacterium]|nr:glycosyltransferase family 2 protein [Acidobacteriota bacterium]
MSGDKILEKKVGEKTNPTPRVSVVIPAYNSAELIGETLDSVLAQTFKNYEIILVNDGSPDTEKLEAALENYYERIIYIRQANGGTAAARNTAIDAAHGEFLAFLDGDDVWLPEYLDAQLSALTTKSCDLIYADAKLFGNLRDKSETYMVKSPSSGAVTTETLLSGQCNVITSGTVVRREKVLAVGKFDADLPPLVSEDFDLWFRLAKSGAWLDYQKKVLLKYRVSQIGLSGSNVQRAERSVAVFRHIEKKYELTATEKEELKKHLNLSLAELEIEKGKYNLLQENFSEARNNFQQANKYYRKLKYSALASLLKVKPELALKLFKRARPAEAAFISPTDSPK